MPNWHRNFVKQTVNRDMVNNRCVFTVKMSIKIQRVQYIFFRAD